MSLETLFPRLVNGYGTNNKFDHKDTRFCSNYREYVPIFNCRDNHLDYFPLNYKTSYSSNIIYYYNEDNNSFVYTRPINIIEDNTIFKTPIKSSNKFLLNLTKNRNQSIFELIEKKELKQYNVAHNYISDSNDNILLCLAVKSFQPCVHPLDETVIIKNFNLFLSSDFLLGKHKSLYNRLTKIYLNKIIESGVKITFLPSETIDKELYSEDLVLKPTTDGNPFTFVQEVGEIIEKEIILQYGE